MLTTKPFLLSLVILCVSLFTGFNAHAQFELGRVFNQFEFVSESNTVNEVGPVRNANDFEQNFSNELFGSPNQATYDLNFDLSNENRGRSLSSSASFDFVVRDGFGGLEGDGGERPSVIGERWQALRATAESTQSFLRDVIVQRPEGADFENGVIVFNWSVDGTSEVSLGTEFGSFELDSPGSVQVNNFSAGAEFSLIADFTDNNDTNLASLPAGVFDGVNVERAVDNSLLEPEINSLNVIFTSDDPNPLLVSIALTTFVQVDIQRSGDAADDILAFSAGELSADFSSTAFLESVEVRETINGEVGEIIQGAVVIDVATGLPLLEALAIPEPSTAICFVLMGAMGLAKRRRV